MEQVNDGFVTILRLLKGALVLMLTIGTKLIQLRQTLGDGFAEFVRTRLPFDLAEAELFMRLAQTPGLVMADFTPPVAVAMPRLMEVYGLVGETYADVAGTPQNGQGNNDAAIPDGVPGPDCEGSADAPVVDNDDQAGADDTAAVGIVPATGAVTPAAGNDVATPATELTPPVGDVVVRDDTAGPAIPDTVSGTAATASQGTAPAAHAEGTTPKAVDVPAGHHPAITAEQRQFLRERSVSLLVKVNKSEMTVEAALRQAETMPKRKTR